MSAILHQMQQLQLQQKSLAATVAAAAPNTPAAATALGLMQELRAQQEALIGQLALNTTANTNAASSTSPSSQHQQQMQQQQQQQPLDASSMMLDPAILGGATSVNKMPTTQSVWGDVPSGELGSFSFFVCSNIIRNAHNE